MGLALLLLCVNAAMAWRIWRRPYDGFHVPVVTGWAFVAVLLIPGWVAVSQDPTQAAQFKAALDAQLQPLVGMLGSLDEQSRAVLIRVLPGLVLMVWAFLIMIDAAFLRWLLHRTGHIPRLLPLRRWIAPDFFLSLILVPLAVLTLRGMDGEPLLEGAGVVAVNTLLMALPVYFLQGVLVVQARLLEAGFRPWMTLIFWASLVLLPFNWMAGLLLGQACLGLMDTWFDFRRLRAPAEGEA